jgi:hypothetical protein
LEVQFDIAINKMRITALIFYKRKKFRVGMLCVLGIR